MCRLAFASRRFLNFVTQYDLTRFFAALDMSNGGSGIGIAYRVPGKPIASKKGLTFDPDQAAQMWIAAYIEGATELLYHARLASVGDQSDANCHPFTRNMSALAHNGTEPTYIDPRDTRSDSCRIAEDIFNRTITVDRLAQLTGTYIGWYKGIPFATANRFSDCVIAFFNADHSAWLIASELTPDLEKKALEVYNAEGYIWKGTRNAINPAIPAHIRAYHTESDPHSLDALEGPLPSDYIEYLQNKARQVQQLLAGCKVPSTTIRLNRLRDHLLVFGRLYGIDLTGTDLVPLTEEKLTSILTALNSLCYNYQEITSDYGSRYETEKDAQAIQALLDYLKMYKIPLVRHFIQGDSDHAWEDHYLYTIDPFCYGKLDKYHDPIDAQPFVPVAWEKDPDDTRYYAVRRTYEDVQKALTLIES
jgi:hypothetical protein